MESLPSNSGSTIPVPQHSGRLDNGAQLPVSHLLDIYRTTGETAESAIGIEKELLGTIIAQRSLRLGDNCFHRLDIVGARVDHPKPQFTVGQGTPDHLDIAGPGSGIFKNKLINAHPLQRRQKPHIVPRQQDVFLLAPVAATDMYADADTLDALDNPIEQIGGEDQLLARITAGGQGRSHEGAPVAVLRHHHLGQHRLIKLDEIAARIAQIE